MYCEIYFFFIGFLSSILLSACVFNRTGCKKIAISQEEKEWLNFSEIGDTILFKNASSAIDTFLFDKRTDYFTHCNKFELGTNQYESNSIALKYLNRKKRENFEVEDVWIGLSKDVNNQNDTNSYKEIKVFDFESNVFSDIGTIKLSEISLKTTGKRYKAFLFDRTGTRSNGDGSKAEIVTFYWSKSDGLIKYITADGEEFEFLKKY